MNKQWTAKDIPSQAGKRAIVTGANSGVGFQTARELARAGAEVVLSGRSPERLQQAVSKIKAEQPVANVQAALLDLSTLASVRAFAEAEHAAAKPLDILVNNAGISVTPRRELTVDGFEKQLATNYLGHFALTALLLPLLLRASKPRVVSISSNAHQRARLEFGDLQLAQGYNPYKAYAQTKLAMLVYALELQRQSNAHGGKLASMAAHPGLSKTAIAKEAEGFVKVMSQALLAVLGQTDVQGALPQLYAAAAPEATPGGYYGPDGFQEFKGFPKAAKIAPPAADTAAGPRLWSLSEQLTGVTYNWSA